MNGYRLFVAQSVAFPVQFIWILHTKERLRSENICSLLCVVRKTGEVNLIPPDFMPTVDQIENNEMVSALIVGCFTYAWKWKNMLFSAFLPIQIFFDTSDGKSVNYSDIRFRKCYFRRFSEYEDNGQGEKNHPTYQNTYRKQSTEFLVRKIADSLGINDEDETLNCLISPTKCTSVLASFKLIVLLDCSYRSVHYFPGCDTRWLQKLWAVNILIQVIYVG